MKVPEGDDGQQSKDLSVVCVSYVLQRKVDDYWNVEHTRYVSKPTEDSNKFVEDLARYYGKSLEIFKEEEEEPEAASAKKSANKKERKGKSKKSI